MRDQIKRNLIKFAVIILFFSIYIYIEILLRSVSTDAILLRHLRVVLLNVISISFGVLLGSESYFAKRDIPRPWYIDKYRIFLIVLPLILLMFLAWTGEVLSWMFFPEINMTLPRWLAIIQNILLSNETVLNLCPLTVGFAFITSFRKESN